MEIIYDLGRASFFVVFKLFYGYKITGRENIPEEGPVIIACNHASYLDPPLVGAGLRRRINFVAKEELFKNPVLRYLFTKWRSFPIKRDQFDKAMLKSILDRLRNGEMVGLFPEGTRSPDENLLPAKPGLGMIVSMANCPVVPAHINGSWRTLGKVNKKLRAVPISLTFGKPMVFEKVEGETGHQRNQRITDAIMAEIEKLKKGV